jgi:hypothetical protein
VRASRVLLSCVVASVAGGSLLGSIHSGGACITAAAQGSCPYTSDQVYRDLNGKSSVTQGVWNPSASQTLTADGLSSWTVTASAASPDAVSSPSTQVLYSLANGHPDPLSNFGVTLGAAWDTTSPPAAAKRAYTWEFKLWLGDPNRDSWSGDQEVQLWTSPHGTVPPGTRTGERYTDTGGNDWLVWFHAGHPTVSGRADIITLVRGKPAAAGSLDLMSLFQWLITSGYTSDGFGIDQIAYGVEITSTAGNATWALTGYTLTTATGTPPATPLAA